MSDQNEPKRPVRIVRGDNDLTSVTSSDLFEHLDSMRAERRAVRAGTLSLIEDGTEFPLGSATLEILPYDDIEPPTNATTREVKLTPRRNLMDRLWIKLGRLLRSKRIMVRGMTHYEIEYMSEERRVWIDRDEEERDE